MAGDKTLITKELIEKATIYNSVAEQQKRETQSYKELLWHESSNLHNYFGKLNCALMEMQRHYAYSERLANDQTLQQELSVLEVFIKNLHILYKRVEVKAESLSTSELQQLTQQLQDLNASLKNVCDTTLLYDVSTRVAKLYPEMYLGNVLLALPNLAFPICIGLIVAGVSIPPVAITLLSIAAAVALLIPVVHFINNQLKQKSFEHPIEFHAECLAGLYDKSQTIDNFINLTSAKQEFPYYSYSSFFTKEKENRKNSYFLEKNEVDIIQKSVPSAKR